MVRGANAQMTLRLRDFINIKVIRSLAFTQYSKIDPPKGAGCYRLYNHNNKIIYVGKAKDLADRIHDHITGQTHTAYFHTEIAKADWWQTESPIIRTLLEGILIAFHKPRYNDEVKDEREFKNGKKSSE
jgi:excinuclease UvrABC nuclease subunit